MGQEAGRGAEALRDLAGGEAVRSGGDGRAWRGEQRDLQSQQITSENYILDEGLMWPPPNMATKAPHLCPCGGENGSAEPEGNRGGKKERLWLRGWSARRCLGERSHALSGGSAGRFPPPILQLLVAARGLAPL